MALYGFALLTHDQTAQFDAADIILVSRETASQTTVIFNDNSTCALTIDGRTLTFGFQFRDQIRREDGFRDADGSRLLIGGSGDQYGL